MKVFRFADGITRPRARQKFLAGALSELAELDNYAAAEKLTPPSPVAKEMAHEILEKLTHTLPRHYSVCLWEDGDVVIYYAGAGWRVSVYCRANGSVAFYVNSPDQHDCEGQYQSADDFPVRLITDALKRIPV